MHVSSTGEEAGDASRVALIREHRPEQAERVPPMLRLRGIAKDFGGVRALRDVDVDIEAGQVHALVGENGAGKSTLGKVLLGVHRADGGSIEMDGVPLDLRSPADALRHEITGIAQEIALVPELSVVENVFLGRQPRRAGVVDRRRLRSAYDELLGRTGLQTTFGAGRRVGTLPLADQQLVEILRAVAQRARVVVMDEPTAALGREQADQVFEAIRQLRRTGTTVVLVSHFLREVLDLADHVTVLRDGQLVKSVPAAGETVDSLVQSMVGRALTRTFAPKRPVPADAPVRLSVQGLRRKGVVDDASLTVRQGEILGLAGLVGAGRTELARLIFGADRSDGGTIEVDGVVMPVKRPRDAVRAGIAYLPESRKDDGLVIGRSILENVALPHLAAMSRAGITNRALELRRCEEMLERVGATPGRTQAPVGTLSGGNQQKVLFARWLLASPKLFIADEPTRGVDVGARASIYALLQDFADQGMGVLLISSDHEEVIGLAHRVIVMRNGRFVAELRGEEINEDQILSAALAG